jgi:uncharacterized coiled-coil protein SlyX
MTLEGYLAILFSFGTNGVLLWAFFRRKRAESRIADARARAEEARADAEIEDGTVTRWQVFAARLEARIELQDKTIDAMRVREIACAEKTARQEEQIAHLTHAVRSLRSDLRGAGIRPGSGTHEALPPAQLPADTPKES